MTSLKTLLRKKSTAKKAPRTRVNVLRMHGNITPGAKGVNINRYAQLIERAFTRMKPNLVILELDTPGGSPSQSQAIYDSLMYWKNKTKVPLYIVVQDMCASGGMWIAMAADKIYASKLAVIGSIGVVVSYMGFTDLMKKLGIESRVHTAGSQKVGMTPFKPETQEQKAKLEKRLTALHDVFKQHIMDGRGSKLDTDAPNLFEGETWFAEEAKKIGLIDAIGYRRDAMQDCPELSSNIKVYVIQPKKGGMLQTLMQSRSETSLGEDIAEALYEKALAEVLTAPFSFR